MKSAKDIDRILEKYGDLLYRTSYVLIGNPHDVQDILQEVLIRYLEKSPDFSDSEHEKAWLLRAAHNLCIDFLRFRRRHCHLELEQIQDVLPAPQDQHVLEELFALPPKLKIALALHYLDGYSVRQIAEIIGSSENAVKKRLQRGRNLLKTKLDQ